MIILNITIWVILLVFLIYTLFVYSRKGLSNSPVNDSNWNIDMQVLYNRLYRFISNRQEKICAVLNVQNALNLLDNGITENGFAILTDKAFYFIGNVKQKKGIFAFKSNIQQRIGVNEIKGIKVDGISSLMSLIYAVLSVMLLSAQIYFLCHPDEVLQSAWEISHDFEGVLEELYIPIVGIFLIGVIYLVAYYLVQVFVIKKTNILLEFAKVSIAFPVSSLGAQEIKNFYKAVSEVQKIIIDSVPSIDARSMEIQIPSDNKIQRLSELSKLYEQGMITEDEFVKLKGEVINNQ